MENTMEFDELDDWVENELKLEHFTMYATIRMTNA